MEEHDLEYYGDTEDLKKAYFELLDKDVEKEAELSNVYGVLGLSLIANVAFILFAFIG